ncbi:unnamed protein product [Peronospora farinosa]|uniref:Transposase n=1 Tax=Peronospora farinosa TaxID=134698 RepID=A0AAV0UIV7_9STRA|nr:unnamed protein product [Peronospora farinosa]CAI5736936.1 unnamed protein product [Peronospora farinosa]
MRQISFKQTGKRKTRPSNNVVRSVRRQAGLREANALDNLYDRHQKSRSEVLNYDDEEKKEGNSYHDDDSTPTANRCVSDNAVEAYDLANSSIDLTTLKPMRYVSASTSS